jgi:hypothetical protein
MSDATRLLEIRYLGSSMSPVLRSLDILLVLPNADRSPRCGDVIVFTAGSGTESIAHRIVARRPGGFLVQGDANPHVDAELVPAEKIVGRVLYARAGSGKRRVYGGTIGRSGAAARRIRRALIGRGRGLFSRPYRILERSKLLPRLVPQRFRPKVVRFSRSGVPQLRLLWGRRTVGTYLPETDRWRIKPPFGLLFDERNVGAPDEPPERT